MYCWLSKDDISRELFVAGLSLFLEIFSTEKTACGQKEAHTRMVTKQPQKEKWKRDRGEAWQHHSVLEFLPKVYFTATQENVFLLKVWFLLAASTPNQ